MYREVQVPREAGEGESVSTGTARIEKLTRAMPVETAGSGQARCFLP